MKNIFFNWNTIVRNKVLLFSFFLFISQVAIAQTITSVTKTNGTCQANASIEVATTVNSTGWTAEIKSTATGSVAIPLTIPNTGNVLFSSLAPGSYNVSITNGLTTVQYTNNPVVITTSYLNNLSVVNATTFGAPPSCSSSLDATYTVNVTGGIGPFVYKLTSLDGTQIIQTATSTLRSYTFTGLSGNVTRKLYVTDQLNGAIGCEYTIAQDAIIPAQTTPALGYGFRAYNFIKEVNSNCASTPTAKLFVNLANLTPARRAFLASDPLYAKITIAGTDYPLTYVAAQDRYTYDPATTGGPALTNGMQITTTFNWDCGILTRTNTVDLRINYLNVFSTVTKNPDCSFKYKVTVIGDSDYTNTGYTDRNIYFREVNTVVIEKKNTATNVWEVLSGTAITPDPATLTSGLNVVSAMTSSIASASNSFFVYETGEYRVTATEDCHSVTKTITITNPVATNPLNAVSKTSLLSGTVGFEVNTGSYQGLYPMTVIVERVDGQTSMPINATGPLTLAGNYNVKFPIVKTFNSNPSWFNIMDLPPGDYQITYTDGCTTSGSTKVQTISLNNLAGYNPQVSVVEGCVNSNSINYALNPIANYTYVPNYTQLKTPAGVIVTNQSKQNYTGAFTSVASGNYLVNFTSSGASGSVFSAALNRFGPFDYTTPITVAPFKNFDITTSTIKCNLSDPTSGIVSVQAVNGTITYPLTFSLFSDSNSTTPLQGPFTVTSPATSYTFTNVSDGNYVVRVNSNNCYIKDQNVTVSSTSPSVPTAQVTKLTTCPGNPSTIAYISPASSLYDITWTNSINSNVVNGMPVTLSPTVTTVYTATFALKSSLGCSNPTTYTSTVAVTVSDNVDLTKTISDIDLCFNPTPNRNITVSNSQLNFTYELTDSNGFSFTPPVTAAGTGNDLILTIPSSAPLVAGTPFKVKVGNGNAGCSGFLNDVVSITSRKSNQTLAVSAISPVCPGTNSKITVEGFESGVTYQIRKNGITLTSGITEQNNGSNKEFTIPANQLVSGTNTFTVITSGSGCTNGELANPAVIIVNQAPAITGTLGPIVIEGCDDVAAPAAYTTVAQLEAKGVTITDAETADNLLAVTYSDSPMVGTLSKVFTRTYTITDPSCSGSSTVTQNITLNITTPTAPTISAATATTFCLGGSVVLTSSATTGNQWYKDGALITDATSSTYTATVPGTYTVTNSVTNTNTIVCTSPASAGVNVVVNALPVATINGGVTLAFVDCTATTIQLTASPGSSYVWYRKLVNETAFSVLPDVTIDITATNLGFYKVKVIDSSTICEAESQVTQVVAKPAVSPTVLQPCVGNTVTLESNTTSFDTPTFRWKKDGIYIADATTHNWDVTEDGEYTVEVTDRRTVGNIGTQTSCGVEVHFNPLPVVEAGTNFTITCTTNPTGLTIGETPEAGFDYVWTSPKGISGLTNATIANPVANPTETTTYTVRKTNQSTGCYKEDTITITVDKTAPTANAGTAFTKTCVANTLGKEIGIAPISGQTYSWSPATGLDNAFIANPNANPETTQTYTLTVENTTNGCTAQATVTASVDVSAPTADAGTAFTKTCVTNPTGQLIGATAVSGETYSWFPTTGLSDATSANPLANPTATTTYTVTARKTATGCTATNSIIVTVLDTPNPVALSTTIANNCPLETVDLVTIQPAAVSGIVYEWWTGTATTRTTQITNPTLYATAGTIYLWSKSVSEGCYNAVPSAVNVTMNVCCESTIGVIQETNPFYLVNYAPADITTLEHVNYATPSVVRYAIVNDLDGKIKQINTTKPEFTQLPAGNYTVHAFVFGPTVVPTGLVVGNKLAQVVPFCGTTATKTLRVQSICSSARSYTETLTNAKQYALLDTTTDQFVQVNTTGKFTMIHTGMPHQVIGFNYSGTATGIQVGGTIAGVTATNLDITAGAIISGCTAVTTQIDGNIYNDKDKRCIEGLNNQSGLPAVTLYAKLLDSSNQVIAVSSAIQSPNYTFSMTPDLLDGVYSIVLDDNDSVTDAVATYPNSWKGNTQTFTIASGQIVEYLSNTPNFVPMCMQAATNKPILKPTANLVGNTYNFCKGVTATSLIIDALPGATVNWYTTAVGGVAKSTPFIPTTSVVGTTTCYVSQTLNGAESDRTEVIIDVHDLPEQPTAISGSNFIAANTTQLYGVVNSTNAVTYNWILPTDWTGTSTSKDITVQVGTKDGTIGVTATSAFGCISPIQELVVRVVLEDDIEVYNSLSPNGDGDNDIFRIRNIDFYPENTLSIFNRWGIEVYHVNSYGQNDNFFKGFSDGRSTTSRDVELPEGTYFYTLTYKNTKGIERNLSGYLYIKQ